MNVWVISESILIKLQENYLLLFYYERLIYLLSGSFWDGRAFLKSCKIQLNADCLRIINNLIF